MSLRFIPDENLSTLKLPSFTVLPEQSRRFIVAPGQISWCSAR